MARPAAEIADLVDLSPEALMADPEILWTAGPREVAARALAYAHATEARSYDEIGFRWTAALPVRDTSPLQTFRRVQIAHERALSKREDPLVERVRREQPLLRHRSIEGPQEGRVRYEYDHEFIHLLRLRTDDHGRPQEDLYTFPVTALPSMFAQGAEERDEPVLLAHTARPALSAMRWLPLRTVIEEAAFPRMQDCRDALVEQIVPGGFYAFLSHRWLTPTHPDPDGRQACFAAWQLVASVCDAVRVAGQRGLHAPRQFSSPLGFVIGVAGSDLAESILVNVLRSALDEAMLDGALAEIVPLERKLSDLGVGQAGSDTDLAELRALLRERPVLDGLVSRIHVWYDYSCLPQGLRDTADEALLAAGLHELVAFQLLGRTVVLLDETEDYLSRGWCTLEAIVADSELGGHDLLVGSERRTAREGRTEFYFETLLEDRPHLVWRAMLDTEVFGTQSPEECLRRLSLRLTEQRDVTIVYDHLRTIRAPVKVHMDASELWTGVLPLPVAGNGFAIMPRSGVRSTTGDGRSPAGTLDWTAALRLGSAHADDALVPEYMRLGSDGAHVAVVASCEGEAVLLARWVLRHRDELRHPVASLSWLAVDIAPVGELPCGSLRAQPVAAPLWIIVATSQRLVRGHAGPALASALAAAGIPSIEIEIDRGAGNVTRVDPPPKRDRSAEPGHVEAVRIPEQGFPVHAGGLLRAFALEVLV